MGTINERDELWESLEDPEFRKQFIDEHVNVGLAFQLRGLRVRQKLTQTRLADLLGDKSRQPQISAWENPNYGKYNLTTLKDLAKTFDVGLLVRFVPFSKLVDWTVDLTKEIIAPPSFAEEQSDLAIDTFGTSIKDIRGDANKGFIYLVPATSNVSSSPPIDPYESIKKGEEQYVA